MIWGRRQQSHTAVPAIVERTKRARPLEPRRTTKRMGFRPAPPQTSPRPTMFVRTVH